MSMADLVYFDEPAPEDAAELDGRAWRHVDSLVGGDRRRPHVALAGRAGYGSWADPPPSRDPGPAPFRLDPAPPPARRAGARRPADDRRGDVPGWGADRG